MIMAIIKKSLINRDKSAACWQVELRNGASSSSSELKSIFRQSSNKPQNNSAFVVLFPRGEEDLFPVHVHGFFSYFSLSFIHKVTLAGTKPHVNKTILL